MKKGLVGVNLIGEESSFFKPGKGLRQGDPISSLLFNFVGDVFTRMFEKVASQGLIKGLLTELDGGGVISLQYADDTIIFSDIGEQYIKNPKCCLRVV